MSRLLVVDDDHVNCQILSKLLARRGYDVHVAYGGSEALDLVKKQDYQLALLDFQMPGMNGAELYRLMREVQPGLGGIFMTATPCIDSIYAAIGAGADRVLAKPVHYGELLPLIAERLSATSQHGSAHGDPMA